MLDAQTKQDLRLYLGYSGRYHQVQTVLEQAMNSIDAAGDTYLEANIATAITNCKAMDARITQCIDRMKFTQIEQLSYAGIKELAGVRMVARMNVRRLSSLLAVPIFEDIYSTDSRSDSLGPVNYMKQG